MSSRPLSSPHVVVTLGIYRSASTWVANVAAEILRLRGPARIIVADSVAEVARQIGSSDAAFVVKTHRPDSSMRCLVRLSGLPVILTVRDPPDCVASLVEQFGEGFENARASVSLSCEAVLWALPFCRPLTLCYEGPSARDEATVTAIASHLGVVLPDGDAAAIAARFAPTEVKRLIDRMSAEGVFGRDPKPHHVHAPTQWHPRHIGTGDVGRHRVVLTPAQLEEVRGTTRPFQEHFSYPMIAMQDVAEVAFS